MFKNIIETLISGGPVMIPIIILSVIVWTLILKKQFELNKENIDANRYTEQITKYLSEDNKVNALNLCRKTSGALPKTLLSILNVEEGTKKSLIQNVREVLHEEYPKLEGNLSTIAILASVAPLLGLLGTVSGMVITFTSIASHGTGDPQALAKGISEALITTQSGLIVAIPALFFHTHLVKKVDTIINNLEKNVIKMINFLIR